MRPKLAIATCATWLVLGSAAPGLGVAAEPAAAGAKASAYEFNVISVPKDKSHPYFGQGTPIGFQVDGVQGPPLTVVRGKTYKFNVDTGIQHDFYLTTDPAGWGVGTLVEGVENNFIYKGVVTFKPTAATPDVVYYQCRNHKFMGNRIQVVNPGEEGKGGK